MLGLKIFSLHNVNGIVSSRKILFKRKSQSHITVIFIFMKEIRVKFKNLRTSMPSYKQLNILWLMNFIEIFVLSTDILVWNFLPRIIFNPITYSNNECF